MTFARWVFRIAGVYGVLVLLPQFFLADEVGRQHPPALTHLEFYYGFVGCALAWQFVFLIMAQDPARYRPLMWPAMLEKFSFAAATAILFSQGRLAAPLFAGGLIDGLLGVLFFVAWLRTGNAAGPPAAV